MKRLILLGLLLPLTALANLGETFQKSCERYGTPDGRSSTGAHWTLYHNSSITGGFHDFVIEEAFNAKGVCDVIWYIRTEPFPEGELFNYLNENRPDQVFRETTTAASWNGGQFWTTPDGAHKRFRFWETTTEPKATALLEEERDVADTLTIFGPGALRHR
jgi:hypothetical protein